MSRLVLIVACAASLSAVGATRAAAPDPDEIAFTETIKPFLFRNCYQCHNERRTKGNLNLKQYANAAREYETMIALKTPDRATAYYYLAQSYLGDGKRSEARKAVLNSLDIAPSYEPAQKLLVEILK